MGWLKNRGRRQWVVIVVHDPLYDAKVGEPWGTTARASEKMKLVRLFRRYGVDLVLQGDVHNYRRHVRADGTTYLTQGMGGARSQARPVHRAGAIRAAVLDEVRSWSPGIPRQRSPALRLDDLCGPLDRKRSPARPTTSSTVDETVDGKVVPAGTRILYERFALTNVIRTAP